MSVLPLLTKIQPHWIHRVMNSMARGAGVRQDFEIQLKRLYDVLVHAVETGDPAWLDPIIVDWAASSTQSDLREGLKNITAVLNQMLAQTYEITREELKP